MIGKENEDRDCSARIEHIIRPGGITSHQFGPRGEIYIYIFKSSIYLHGAHRQTVADTLYLLIITKNRKEKRENRRHIK